MSLTPAQLLRGLAVIGLLVAWAVAAHIGSTGEGSPNLTTTLGVGPFVLIIAWLLWRVRQPLLIAAGVGLTSVALFWAWPHLRANVPLLYYLQHVGSQLALAVFFGRTLFGPGEALITRIARAAAQGEISPLKARYTRQVTLVWALFFLANGLVSTVLFLFASPAIWSLHANVLSGPLMGVMFVAEHLWRIRVLPPAERPSMATAIRAYRQGMQSPARQSDPQA
ncbi:MAG: hypothetical protein L6Q40_02445 [Azonexus sp.]|nr:hypothetical protein [Azonexus sp.]